MATRERTPQDHDRRPLVSGVQEWLYVIIVASLSLYLVIGVLLWSWMILVGRAAPDSFTTILAAIAGALAGLVTPLQGPPSRRGGQANGADGADG